MTSPNQPGVRECHHKTKSRLEADIAKTLTAVKSSLSLPDVEFCLETYHQQLFFIAFLGLGSYQHNFKNRSIYNDL